ncbi:MAG: rod-binding protein [Lachnospiraceae bacterium]|nr:rod-binding protein [Lachnospiraceae bacterium]
MDGIGGFSSAYADYVQSQNTAETKLKETISGTDYSQATDDELMDACKQFEAYFLEQVFKEMEKTVDCWRDEDSLDKSNSMVDYFKDNAIQDLAATSTEIQGLGLAQTLYEQMKRNYGL